uniref:uncharacterized protein LOC128932625 n=1 Tax=Callithrix jacchus TaxID=9483 RepID=UPI0023DD5959|nr:uncharacterized protein LOC128932625 [Callithrix jacchus]
MGSAARPNHAVAAEGRGENCQGRRGRVWGGAGSREQGAHRPLCRGRPGSFAHAFHWVATSGSSCTRLLPLPLCCSAAGWDSTSRLGRPGRSPSSDRLRSTSLQSATDPLALGSGRYTPKSAPPRPARLQGARAPQPGRSDSGSVLWGIPAHP